MSTKAGQFQLASQRVAYLLGAGSSYLDGNGYPLAFELWDLLKGHIDDLQAVAAIQGALDNGATGLEHALDLLDDGGASDTPYRHMVTEAIADLFATKAPPLEAHMEFMRRLSQRAEPHVSLFSLNYDPLLERASDAARVRVADGFLGVERAFFDSSVFDERTGRIRGSHRGRQFEETARAVRLFKLHGSLGWYECPVNGVRRCGFGLSIPSGTRRLMIPPQRRKATDTMSPPYSALWTRFRACLSHDAHPANRLACMGYGFGDEHVNDVVEAALARHDFTLLVFAKALSDQAWARWSIKANAIVVTEDRCALKGELGPGHADLWRFERLCQEV